MSDLGNHRICHLRPDGTLAIVAGSSLPSNNLFLSNGYRDGAGAAAQFSVPLGMIATASGSLLIADHDNCRIREVKSDGTVTTFAGCGTIGSMDGPALQASFRYLADLALDSKGNVYAADEGLRRISPDGQVTTLFGSDSNNVPHHVGAVAVDHSDTVYFFDGGLLMRLESDGRAVPFAGQKFWPPKRGEARSLPYLPWWQVAASSSPLFSSQ